MLNIINVYLAVSYFLGVVAALSYICIIWFDENVYTRKQLARRTLLAAGLSIISPISIIASLVYLLVWLIYTAVKEK